MGIGTRLAAWNRDFEMTINKTVGGKYAIFFPKPTPDRPLWAAFSTLQGRQ